MGKRGHLQRNIGRVPDSACLDCSKSQSQAISSLAEEFIEKRILRKLAPPAATVEHVGTRALSSLMDGGGLSKVTLITAPPGFGKTVLLSQVYRKLAEAGSTVRWIGLDERDAGYGNLLTLTALAIGQKKRQFRDTERLLRDHRDQVEAILGALAPAALTLFIDNVDFCQETGVDNLLNSLVFETPDAVKIVISSSKATVPLQIGRARLEGKLKVITASELNFDREAVAKLFSFAGLGDIDTGVLDAVISKTEGWPAAVRLLQLSNNSEDELKRGVALFSGKDPHISDILSSRLVSILDPDLARFLLEISGLGIFSAELALAATGDKRAPAWLDFIVERNMLIIPVDERLVWFRFHTLLREFLKKEAACKISAPRRQEVLRSAARWLMQHGDYQAALELAINARELDLTSQLLDEAACVLVRDLGDTSTFNKWVERANEIGAKRSIATMSWHVWSLLFERRFEQAQKEASAITICLKEAPAGTYPAALHAKNGFAESVAAVHLDASESVLPTVENWLSEYPHAEPFEIAAMAGIKACSMLVRHDFAAARSALRLAHATISRSSSIYGVCWVEVLTALVDLAQGNAATVEQRLHDLQRQLHAEAQPPQGIGAVVGIVRARALYDCGLFEEARYLIEKHLPRAASIGILDTTWLGLEVALPFALDEAFSLDMEDLLTIVKKYPKRLSILFELKAIRLLLLQDRTEQAIDHAERLGWHSTSGWHGSLLENASKMELSAARCTAASLLAAAGRLSAALEILKHEMRHTKDSGRRKELIELSLTHVEVHLRGGALAAALRSLRQAISVAARRKIYSPFLERRSLILLLRENLRSKDLGLTNQEEMAALSAIRRLIGLDADENAPSDAATAVQYISDHLTPREVQLLNLLDSGLDNAAIAVRLAVTVRTIKFHLSNLYAKLDVKNRSAAVAKGRSLRLL